MGERSDELVQCAYLRVPNSNSLSLRSPLVTLKVMMGLQYDKGVDLWSIGVTIFELCAGRVMFPGNDNTDMLHKIQQMLGPFPPKMIKRHMLAFPGLGLEEKVHFNEVSARVAKRRVAFGSLLILIRFARCTGS